MTVTGTITLKKHCVVCEKDHFITVSATSYIRWSSGELIQNVWPEFTAVEREAIISGICSQECWDNLFKNTREEQ